MAHESLFSFRKVLLLVSLFGWSQTLTAQQTDIHRQLDSLNSVAEKLLDYNYNDAARVIDKALLLAQKAPHTLGHIKAAGIRTEILMHTNRVPEATKLIASLIASESRIKDPAAKVALYLSLGLYYYDYGDFESSQTYFKKAEAESVQTPIREPQWYVRMAMLYLKLGNHAEAIRYYDKAKKLYESHPTPRDEGWLAYCYGQVYYYQRLYEPSLESSAKSLKIFTALKNPRGIAYGELSRGNALYLHGFDDDAGKSYENALANFLKLADNDGAAICYSNLSRVALEKQNHQEAIRYAQLALETIGSGNKKLEAATYQQLADVYGELGDIPKAISSVNKALSIARETDNKIVVRDCYKSLSEMYEATSQHQKAYQYLLAAYRIKDSIQPLEFNRQLAQMQTRYETEKKEAQIKLLTQQRKIDSLLMRDQENKLRKHRMLLVMSLVVATAAIAALYFYFSRKRLLERIREKERIREAEENERQRIAKDIHDDFGSGLSKIKVLSDIASRSANSDIDTLQSISSTSTSLIENIRDLVWAMRPENSTLDSLVARLREYTYDYLENLPITVNFSAPAEIPSVPISKTASRNIQMIFKEAIQNIIKHAQATTVSIDITADSSFTIKIQDNGKGFNSPASSSGNGFRNMHHRAQAIHGSLHINAVPNQGTTLTLSVQNENLNLIG